MFSFNVISKLDGTNLVKDNIEIKMRYIYLVCKISNINFDKRSKDIFIAYAIIVELLKSSTS